MPSTIIYCESDYCEDDYTYLDVSWLVIDNILHVQKVSSLNVALLARGTVTISMTGKAPGVWANGKAPGADFS